MPGICCQANALVKIQKKLAVTSFNQHTKHTLMKTTVHHAKMLAYNEYPCSTDFFFLLGIQFY